jgi:hypothetical protein
VRASTVGAARGLEAVSKARIAPVDELTIPTRRAFGAF